MTVRYVCDDCGVSGVKLWREYNTFLDNQILRCCGCAEKNQGKSCGLRAGARPVTDQIGWLVPAVPDVLPPGEASTFWGYTSVPQEGCEWWAALPLEAAP